MPKYFALLLLVGSFGCGTAEKADVTPGSAAETKLLVYVVNYPLEYFAKRIGGDRVEVRFPAPRDKDPAEWNPGVETVAEYQKADLILLNGATYAKWTGRVSLPESKLVDTSAGFQDRYILMEDAVVHSHGPEGEHSHGETAFTTWLDPRLAVEQARAISDALIRARPAGRSELEERFASLERDLLGLDEKLGKAVAGKAELPLVASHPVYQYLARRYGLSLHAVHFEPGAAPDSEGWHGLEHWLEEHPTKWMLWEGEPLPETASKLRDLGLESVVFDPCGNRPDKGDYLSVMQSNAAALEAVFSVVLDQ